MNSDSSIFPYKTFGNDNISIGVQDPWSAYVSLWIIIQCHLANFKFVALQRHFLSAENILAVNTRYPVINLADSLLLLARIRLPHRPQIFNQINHFVRL
jgi:hypothetical protein